MSPAAPGERRVLSVTQLMAAGKRLLKEAFPSVWVAGEISNFHLHGSGHMYFTLKDRESALACAMFKGDAARLGRWRPADGMQVEARGRVTLYAPRSTFQMVVSELREAGQGDLQRMFEELKARLSAEGLFETDRKRKLPGFPERVGVVTSPTGAVLRDIMNVSRRRWPGVQLVLAPAPVQGAGAAAGVARAVELMNREHAADVLIVGRGGGSLEDLWAFNEEAVVRAVAGSAIPVISAVGHETDVTLCDFAADVRAATPSMAAELAVPDRAEYEQRVRAAGTRVLRGLRGSLDQLRLRVERLAHSHALGRPRDLLAAHLQRLDDLEIRLARGGVRELERHRLALARVAERLEGLGPAQVMARGYCYVERGADGRPVSSVEGLAPGAKVRLVMRDGRAGATVDEVEPASA